MCGSSARTDLYGGQLAIAVPTVTGVTANAEYGGYSVCSASLVLLPFYFGSPETAHEWLPWRRAFADFAPRLFQ